MSATHTNKEYLSGSELPTNVVIISTINLYIAANWFGLKDIDKNKYKMFLRNNLGDKIWKV